MLYFRTDANEQIASGHVMRCIAIAEAAKELGEDSTFIMADNKSIQLVESRGFKAIVLDTVWNDMESEIDKLASIIREYNIDKLLVDSYSITMNYMTAISKCTKLILIDDFGNEIYPVDVLINYGFMCEKIPYKKMYRDAGYSDVRFLTGSRYVPLRKEFENPDYTIREKVENVLITTGGSDGYNVAGQFLKKALEDDGFKELRYHVVVGCFNINKEMLRSMEKKYGNIIIHENVENMSELMQMCDIAITAGGTTTFELCSVGIPSVCLSIASNQYEGIKKWEREGVMLSAGDMEHNPQTCICGIIHNIKKYIASLDLRKEKSKKMRELIDGLGAKRIAKEII